MKQGNKEWQALRKEEQYDKFHYKFINNTTINCVIDNLTNSITDAIKNSSSHYKNCR